MFPLRQISYSIPGVDFHGVAYQRRWIFNSNVSEIQAVLLLAWKWRHSRMFYPPICRRIHLHTAYGSRRHKTRGCDRRLLQEAAILAPIRFD